MEELNMLIKDYIIQQEHTKKHTTKWNMLWKFIDDLKYLKLEFKEYKYKWIKFWEKIMIRRLKEKVTPRDNMIEYLKWEKIVRPQYSKYTKQEAKAYNDWLKTAINMIESYSTRLE